MKDQSHVLKIMDASVKVLDWGLWCCCYWQVLTYNKCVEFAIVCDVAACCMFVPWSPKKEKN